MRCEYWLKKCQNFQVQERQLPLWKPSYRFIPKFLAAEFLSVHHQTVLWIYWFVCFIGKNYIQTIYSQQRNYLLSVITKSLNEIQCTESPINGSSRNWNNPETKQILRSILLYFFTIKTPKKTETEFWKVDKNLKIYLLQHTVSGSTSHMLLIGIKIHSSDPK